MLPSAELQPVPAWEADFCHALAHDIASVQPTMPDVLPTLLFLCPVFGHNDAFCRLQPFLRKWRAAAEAAAAAGAALQPYIGAHGGRAVPL